MGCGDALRLGQLPGPRRHGAAVAPAARRRGARGRFRDPAVARPARRRAAARPDGAPYLDAEAQAALPLSSRVALGRAGGPAGRRAAAPADGHPTPPLFDGPEGLNRLRNRDEVASGRTTSTGARCRDDAGPRRRPRRTRRWSLLGDFNLDPLDGAGERDAVGRLLGASAAAGPAPASAGGDAAAAQGGANAGHRGDPALDTADWRDDARAGQPAGRLRAAVGRARGGRRRGVLAAPRTTRRPALLADGPAHRLVWVDVALP